MTPTQRKQKHRQLMTILNRLGVDADARHDLVYTWTEGRTKSTTKLSDTELINLVWKFENDSRTQNAKAMAELEKKKKRATVLSIAQRCDIHTGTNFKKFNRFMLNNSILKKELHKYSINELDDLIKQFRGLERNYKRSAETAGTKAYNHAHGFAPMNFN